MNLLFLYRKQIPYNNGRTVFILISMTSVIIILQQFILLSFVSSFSIQNNHNKQHQNILSIYNNNNNNSPKNTFIIDNRYNSLYNNNYTNKRIQISLNNKKIKRSSTLSTTTTSLYMALIPLNIYEIQSLICINNNNYKPTSLQYQSYFGRTQNERYSRIVESCIVALLGISCSYFLSYVIGSFVSTILGTLSLLWGILSPELKAYQRNWEFLGGRQLIDINNNNENNEDNNDNNNNGGLYGALWIGYVNDVCIVEDSTDVNTYNLYEFNDYTIENDELDKYTGQPYLIRLQLKDKEGKRTLQIHAKMSEEYLNIKPGMTSTVLLLSTDINFTTLAVLTDVYILDTSIDNVNINNNNNNNNNDNEKTAVIVGDYPYLNRAGLEELLTNDVDIWDILINQQQDELMIKYINDNKINNNNDKTNKNDFNYDPYYNNDNEINDTYNDDNTPIRRGKRNNDYNEYDDDDEEDDNYYNNKYNDDEEEDEMSSSSDKLVPIRSRRQKRR